MKTCDIQEYIEKRLSVYNIDQADWSNEIEKKWNKDMNVLVTTVTKHVLLSTSTYKNIFGDWYDSMIDWLYERFQDYESIRYPDCLIGWYVYVVDKYCQIEESPDGKTIFVAYQLDGEVKTHTMMLLATDEYEVDEGLEVLLEKFKEG